jgi:hypothetical protein
MNETLRMRITVTSSVFTDQLGNSVVVRGGGGGGVFLRPPSPLKTNRTQIFASWVLPSPSESLKKVTSLY